MIVILFVILLRNWFCTTLPILLSRNSAVLPKEVSDSVCHWAFWYGFDFCPRSLHSVALGPVRLARYAVNFC